LLRGLGDAQRASGGEARARLSALESLQPQPLVRLLGGRGGRSGMRFSGDVAATFASRLILVGFGVASSVLTARYLGPAGRGSLATPPALAGIGLQLGNLGLHA